MHGTADPGAAASALRKGTGDSQVGHLSVRKATGDSLVGRLSVRKATGDSLVTPSRVRKATGDPQTERSQYSFTRSISPSTAFLTMPLISGTVNRDSNSWGRASMLRVR